MGNQRDGVARAFSTAREKGVAALHGRELLDLHDHMAKSGQDGSTENRALAAKLRAEIIRRMGP